MSVAYVAPSLADLNSRAGPPDTDRPAWLAFRRTGITATEVRDLHLGEITADDLAKAKHGGDGIDLSGNVYIAWGNEREPVIAERLRSSLGMEPEHRVFHAQENSRHLASPDGVGVDFDELLEISEIKTGGYRYFGHAGMVDKGYLVQMVWGMYVTGAWRCRYEFETREQHPMGGFAPGSVYAEWVVLDEHLDLLERLIDTADAALAVIDAYADGERPSIREDVDLEAVRYLHAVDEVKRTKPIEMQAKAARVAAEVAKSDAFEAVRALAGAGELVQESPFARVTKRADVEEDSDVREVDEQHPDVVAARSAVVDAQAALAAVMEMHTTVRQERVVKKGGLTITSPQRRKEQSA